MFFSLYTLVTSLYGTPLAQRGLIYSMVQLIMIILSLTALTCCIAQGVLLVHVSKHIKNSNLLTCTSKTKRSFLLDHKRFVQSYSLENLNYHVLINLRCMLIYITFIASLNYVCMHVHSFI